MKRYTREVSPDRRGIISSGLRAFSKNTQGGLEPMKSIEIVYDQSGSSQTNRNVHDL